MLVAKFILTMIASIYSFRILRAETKVSECSSTVLKAKEDTCLQKFNLTEYIQSGIPLPMFETEVDELCRHVPDVISCLKKAFEPCNKPYFDHRTYNTTFVKICSNKRLYMQSEGNCDETPLVISQCLLNYRSNAKRIRGNKSTDETSCTLLSEMRDCLHINTSVMCKQEFSEFLTSLYKGRFSSTVCDVYINTKLDWSTSSGNKVHEREMNQSSANSASCINFSFYEFTFYCFNCLLINLLLFISLLLNNTSS